MGNSNTIGEAGSFHFGHVVFSQGHIWRGSTGCDLGIDGHIEFLDEKYSTKTSKNLICGVQIKTKTTKQNSTMKLTSIDYWKNYPLPVIIVQICIIAGEPIDIRWLKIDQMVSAAEKIDASKDQKEITFQHNESKVFKCSDVEDYCIEYMKNNNVSYKNNTYLGLCNIANNSNKKIESLLEENIQQFIDQLKSNYIHGKWDGKIKIKIGCLSEILDYHLIGALDQIKYSIEAERISIVDIVILMESFNKSEITSSFENCSKWFSYLYCAINPDLNLIYDQLKSVSYENVWRIKNVLKGIWRISTLKDVQQNESNTILNINSRNVLSIAIGSAFQNHNDLICTTKNQNYQGRWLITNVRKINSFKKMESKPFKFQSIEYKLELQLRDQTYMFSLTNTSNIRPIGFYIYLGPMEINMRISFKGEISFNLKEMEYLILNGRMVVDFYIPPPNIKIINS